MSAVLVSLLGVFFVLLLGIGAPIALALAGSAMGVLAVLGRGRQLLSLPMAMAGATDSHVLLAIPFFILAGTLLAESAISKRLVTLASILTRRLPGGLGVAMIVAGIFLAGISGSGPADVAILGTVMLPVLVQRGYGRGLASGLTAISGSIGIIVPPSIALIIYGSVAPSTVSIGELFLGGVGPGLCFGTLLAGTVVLMRRRAPRDAPPGPDAAGRPDGTGLVRAVWEAGWALLFPGIILGGIYFGIFTPTESAAVAVVYSLFVSGVVYRELSWGRLLRCLAAAARVTAGVMILVAAAAVFARLLAFEGIVQDAAGALRDTIRNPWLLLLGANLLVLGAGCFLDAISIFYILVPILLPELIAAGFDPVQMGIVFTVNLAIGQVTPPVGVNLFVSCELGRCGIGETLRESWPLLAAAAAALVLVNLVPAITLWLPQTMR